jgi:hypothetical protein
MNRPRIGLALGSGSARGWAHIVVIDSLIEAASSLTSSAERRSARWSARLMLPASSGGLRQWAEAATWRTILRLTGVRLTGGGPEIFSSTRRNGARSNEGELAALRRVASQRLLEHAEDAEVRIRPFVDHDEPAFAAAGTDRSVVFGRQLGRYRVQVYKNTHGRVL